MSDDRHTQTQGLSFVLDGSGRKLLAHFAPVESRITIDGEWLKKEIAAQGFGQLFLSDAALARLIKQYASASEPFDLEIGEIRDAGVTVELAPDKMTAYLTITPPCGGVKVTREQILAALAEKQVVSGILDEEIERLAVAGEALKHPVAQGHETVHGEDGRLQCLIDMARDRHPRLDEHDRADYRDFGGGIATVRQGERLMQKIPPTPGTAGINVLGQAMPAKPGKEAAFSTRLKGAAIDPENPDFLRAEISGRPVLENNGMAVEPTITIGTVNLATGNLDFEGSINITGDVHAGMTVRASGDIHVSGTVEAADMDAGGDIVVKGGIIGHGGEHDYPGDKEKIIVARVRCGVSCSALFVENAHVEAGDSILIDKQVMQSELTAANRIVVGKPGAAGRGSIIGGLAEATLLVQAKEIGSPGGIKTRVRVGTNPYIHEKLRKAASLLEAKAKELDEIIKLLKYIEENPERIKAEIRSKAENTRAALLQEIEQAQQGKDELDLALELADDAKVVVEKTVFDNVQVEIGGKIHHVELERSGGTFSLKEGEIQFT